MKQKTKAETADNVVIKIFLPSSLKKRWEKFTFDRGYGKGPFLRTFIEAVTDPVRGPQIERIIQNREPLCEAENALLGKKPEKAA